jgi:5-formyltetrahydrofolate cyclo-ligase
LRTRLRRERRQLPLQQKQEAAEDLCNVVLKHPAFLRARRIAYYLASDGEIDPWPLMLKACTRGKQAYLPIVSDRLTRWRPSPLSFQTYVPGDHLVKNRFDILEPAYDPLAEERPWMLDIILLPLVGFDRRGARLGMGAGFYDRALADLTRRFRRPLLVGVGYAMQEVEKIEIRAWDVALDAIATETEFIWTT